MKCQACGHSCNDPDDRFTRIAAQLGPLHKVDPREVTALWFLLRGVCRVIDGDRKGWFEIKGAIEEPVTQLKIENGSLQKESWE